MLEEKYVTPAAEFTKQHYKLVHPQRSLEAQEAFKEDCGDRHLKTYGGTVRVQYIVHSLVDGRLSGGTPEQFTQWWAYEAKRDLVLGEITGGWQLWRLRRGERLGQKSTLALLFSAALSPLPTRALSVLGMQLSNA
eukprot:1146741-Pelagomonas_calceolata.AAC.3